MQKTKKERNYKSIRTRKRLFVRKDRNNIILTNIIITHGQVIVYPLPLLSFIIIVIVLSSILLTLVLI
jgi:hypothetical protein